MRQQLANVIVSYKQWTYFLFFFAISKRFGDPGKIGTYIGYIHFVKVENLESDPKKKLRFHEIFTKIAL